ncbi:TetR/AcrR family transcriptional regulator [Streptomyces sp. NPDC058307]|uniref:TetR/AcrR family transcriptional regulator n=1 Tax=Streptomyces sp. NPDC058307 TaxID=3346439 RepID=UPI0036EBAA3C
METKKSGPIGRPRGFASDEALERAMLVFWEHGYEGASLSRLTSAMGISATSMYAAFGNKQELFRKALARYDEGPSAYLAQALQEPTALGVATAILEGNIRTTTLPAHPTGCLGVQGALAASESGREIRDLLVRWRNDSYSCIRERFQQAIDEGDLPARTDPGLLARYLTTMAFGIAVQAASGVDRKELQDTAHAALRNWPPTY